MNFLRQEEAQRVVWLVLL